jgi:hypothetical protein
MLFYVQTMGYMFKLLAGESHIFLARRDRFPTNLCLLLFLLNASKTFPNVNLDCLELRDGVLEKHLEVSLVPLSSLWGWFEGCKEIILACLEMR